MIDFWNIESHLYIFWQPTILFHDQKRNPQLMSSFSMFHFILIVQCVTSGFIYCTLFKFCFEVRNPISFCFGLDFFSSYCALHYAIKMLGKHKLMYLTHRRYGVLWGPSRAGVIHQKISVKAFTTSVNVQCDVSLLTQPLLKQTPLTERDPLGLNLLSIQLPEHWALAEVSSPFRHWYLAFNIKN